MKDLIVSGPLIKIVFPPPSLLKANEISVKGQFYLSICSESTDKSPGRCDKVSPALDHVTIWKPALSISQIHHLKIS